MRKVRQEIGGLGNLLFKEAYIWSQFRDSEIPDIYVQSMKYWEKYREEIRNRFGNGIGKVDRIALHIRRGDYLKVSQFHRDLWETDYYKEAVKLFPGEKFLVFCKDNQSEQQDEDDRVWCMDNMPFLLPADRYEMYNHTTETDDLNAMASCKGIIGANSSFSWWAAFLGDTDKKVVMPRADRWFVDKKIRCELPSEWTTL
jgi:hypothetical protein